ncbi:MAG: hypothetical protein AB8G16_08695 [Gammaproteobacteria bacterium]
MILETLAWLTAYVSFVTVFFLFRAQTGALLIYFIIITIIFFSPGVYYLFGGTAYRVFTDDALGSYLRTGTVLFLLSVGVVIIKTKLQRRFAVHGVVAPPVPNTLVDLYCLGALAIATLYVAAFFREFALVSILTGGGKIARLDTTGAVPMYFTISTLFHIVLPSAFVLYCANLKSTTVKALLLLVAVFFLAVSGHRGIVAFFLIFLWAYFLHRRLGLVAVLGGVFLLALYTVVQGITEFDQETIMYALSAPLRRLFVTQGAGMIVRFHLLESGFLFDLAGVKDQVYRLVYGSTGAGSMPTFFFADMLVVHGRALALLALTLFLFFVTVIAAWIDGRHPGNHVIMWSFYVAVYFFGFSEVGLSNALRALVIGVNLALIHFLAGSRPLIMSSRVSPIGR